MKLIFEIVLAALTFCPVAAIIDGTFDANNEYPSDGALVFEIPEAGSDYATGCSGVLIHPKIFLTAAHCVDDTPFFDDNGYPSGPGIWVSFDNDLSDADTEGGKCTTCLDIERAVTSSHWDIPGSAGDVAAVILKEDYTQAGAAELPSLGYFDALKASKNLKKSPIINVGYGGSFNEATKAKYDLEYLGKRMFSISSVKSLGKNFIGLNMNKNQGNGGSCGGDSGGSAYYTDKRGKLILTGITSRGDKNCISTARIMRLDIPDSFTFISCILDEVNGGKDFDTCN